ncbi:hypothetical protein JCM16303_001338 [Sporobolomyces ruberrimus]
MSSPTPRSRAMKPSLKCSNSQLQQHKPRVPSRLSFSSLPPLPPLPTTECAESSSSSPTTLGVSPLSSSKRSRSPTRSSSNGPKLKRPTPKPRKTYSPETVESALGNVGAVYIGWEQGSRDPAPLCCPVQKEMIKQRFGDAAVGWMTTPPPPNSQRELPSLLPPLPIPKVTSVDTPCPPQDFLQNFSYSPSSLSPPSLLSYDAASSGSSSSSFSSVSPPTYPFESDQLVFTTNSNASEETLALAPLDAFLPSSTSMIKNEEQDPCLDLDLDLDVMSEHLWSSSEENLTGGGFFSGDYSSGESEASWAW